MPVEIAWIHFLGIWRLGADWKNSWHVSKLCCLHGATESPWRLRITIGPALEAAHLGEAREIDAHPGSGSCSQCHLLAKFSTSPFYKGERDEYQLQHHRRVRRNLTGAEDD